MEDGRIPEKVLNRKYHSKRSVGRTRTRWEDIAQWSALQVVGIRGWWIRVCNRQKWRRLFEGGQGPEGAVVPYIGRWTFR